MSRKESDTSHWTAGQARLQDHLGSLAVSGALGRKGSIMRVNRRTKLAVASGHTRAGEVGAVAVARGHRSKRAVVVGSLAAAMIVSLSPVAGAHGGDDDKVHACVVSNSGTLRIVGAGETCRTGETSLDWSAGSNGIGQGTILGELNPAPGAATGHLALGTVSGQGDNDDPALGDNGNVTGNLGLRAVGRGNLVDGAVDHTKLSGLLLNDLVTEAEITVLLHRQKNDESAATGPRMPNDGDGFLHWNHLESIPSEIADGDDDDGSAQVAQLKRDLEAGALGISIDGRSIVPGTIRSAQLAGSDTDTDLNMPGDQTIVGAITSEKIADRTIATRDLDLTLTQLLQALQEKVADLEARVAALEAK